MNDDGSEMTFQVKPFREVYKDNGVVTVNGVGNSKDYKVDFLVLVGQGENNENFLLIDNKGPVKSGYGTYTFPERLLKRDSGNLVENFNIFREIFIL